MQFIDLFSQQQRIRQKIEEKIRTVLEHGQYIMGPEINELEKKLAEFVGVKHCIGCASGTDALLMSLMAYDVGPGDAVFTTPFTFIATAEVITLLGATPVFVEIDPKTYNIDPDKLTLAIEALKTCNPSIYSLPKDINQDIPAITPKGVISVDLFGLPCDYDLINTIAREHGLFLIEDAAQSLGGEYKGKMACSLADIGCTSFFPAKPLGAYGDGGAVFTDRGEMAERLYSIRVHGQGEDKYNNVRIGLNARMDTLQAAILLAKLDIFPQEIDLRQMAAQRYTELLSPYTKLCTPWVPEGYKSVWAQYSLLTENSELRAKIQDSLKKAGVPTAVYYPKPLHLQTAFAGLGYEQGDFPIAEDTANRIFSLPMHPYLKLDEIEQICTVMGEPLHL